jgi:hypothetical protein
MPERIGSGHIEGRVIVRSTKEFVLQVAGAEVIDGQSDSVIVGDYNEGLLAIDVTATAGTTPSTVFKLQTKVNGVWKDVPDITIAAVTAAISTINKVTNFGNEIRLTWDLDADTTSITFSASFLGKS